VTLAEAREKREEAKKLLAKDINPSTAKKQAKRQARLNAANTFDAVAREWHGKQSERWEPKTSAKILRYLENDIFPHIGSRPIGDIDAPELLDALRKIESRGAYYNAARIRQYCGMIFRYGVATGKAQREPGGRLERGSGNSQDGALCGPEY
jgi:integrase